MENKNFLRFNSSFFVLDFSQGKLLCYLFDRFEYLLWLNISCDGQIQIFRSIKLCMISSNFFHCRRFAKVLQLAAGLPAVAGVAGIKLVDHGQVEDVRGLVFSSLYDLITQLLIPKDSGIILFCFLALIVSEWDSNLQNSNWYLIALKYLTISPKGIKWKVMTGERIFVKYWKYKNVI